MEIATAGRVTYGRHSGAGNIGPGSRTKQWPTPATWTQTPAGAGSKTPTREQWS